MKIFIQKAPEERDRRDEQEHRRAERKNWGIQNTIGRQQNIVSVFGLFVSLFAAGGAVWAAVYAKAAYTQAKRQADLSQAAIISTNRAWVSADLLSMKMTRASDDVISVVVRINITNDGGTPALHAGAFAAIVFQKDMIGGDTSAVRKVCSTDPARVEDVLFPKASIPIPTEAILKKVDALEWQHSQQAKANSPIKWMKLVTCGVYKIIGDDNWHYTGQINTLVNTGPMTDEGYETRPLTLDQDFATSKITVLRNEGGDYAN